MANANTRRHKRRSKKVHEKPAYIPNKMTLEKSHRLTAVVSSANPPPFPEKSPLNWMIRGQPMALNKPKNLIALLENKRTLVVPACFTDSLTAFDAYTLFQHFKSYPVTTIIFLQRPKTTLALEILTVVSQSYDSAPNMNRSKAINVVVLD